MYWYARYVLATQGFRTQYLLLTCSRFLLRPALVLLALPACVIYAHEVFTYDSLAGLVMRFGC
jgi:hypothetical protein